MPKIKGIDITLITQTQTGTDDFGRPIYSETSETVHNVLVGQPTTDDITSSQDLTGKVAVYVLGIPKTDAHDWTDRIVEFFGQRFKTFGFPVKGIDANIPLSWNTKVKVERYE